MASPQPIATDYKGELRQTTAFSLPTEDALNEFHYISLFLVVVFVLVFFTLKGERS